MGYSLNPNLNAVAPPPIAEAQSWTRDLPDDGRTLLDLAQAVPSAPPPAELRRHLAERVLRDVGHTYTEILGRRELRRATAAHLSQHYDGTVGPEQVAITAGCNQAFCYAISAVASAGDEVILPTPYYFNHQMWLEIQGVRAVHLPCDMANGAVPDPQAAAKLIGRNTRALVLVTPNNPTGAVYPPETLDAVFELAQAHGIALILDETYKDFLPEPRAPHGLFRRRDWAETLIHLYSFSKAYSLTGHRVGALTGSEQTLAGVSKMADCVAICPAVTGQEAALYALEHLREHLEMNRQTMAARVADLRSAFAGANLEYELVSAGAYFAYLKHPFDGEASFEVARRLVREQKVLALPGEMFGPEQARYLRLAFANLGSDTFPDLAQRLKTSQRRRAA